MDLLEYEQKGFLFSGNITLKRVNYINRILSIGKEEVLRVLTVDAKKGFIDLCKKDVKADEIDMCKIRYGKSKQVENIVKIPLFDKGDFYLFIQCRSEKSKAQIDYITEIFD